MKHILKLSIITLAIILLSGCTDKDNSYRVLSKEGYTNINFTGYSWFGCSSENDIFKTNFTATKDGKYYEGTVCRGIFSGSVVRIR